MSFRLLAALIAAFLLSTTALAQEETAEPPAPLCPARPLESGADPAMPGGLIMTAFDARALWAYDVERGGRYPLSDTRACAGACRLSPDGRELLYLYEGTNAYNRMRLDGAVREMVVEYAGQVEWWGPEIFLVYTPGHTVYLLDGETGEREDLPGAGVVMVQPGGRFALVLHDTGGQVVRALRDLRLPPDSALRDLPLAPDRAYSNASAWSPDGAWLAFVAPVGAASSELFGIQPGMTVPQQWTSLTTDYGPVRLNGQALGELSWSPDGSRLAFWVTPLNGDDASAPAAPAVIHVLDVETGAVTPMCGYATFNHTPNPPRLVWSPDSSYLAFADDVPEGARGTLVALNTATGEYHALTSGVAAVAGPPNLIAWGLKP
jgi:dipeptidyl aminopeptidase/acylaminoacyl peptidase